LLPIDQLIISLAQDLFSEPDKLATAHKLAAVLRQARKMHPEWQIDVLSDELGKVAKDRRRFLGFSEDDTGFEPERYKGEVVVATIHKAKGLNGTVYILSVNNFVFPSTDEDPYHSDRWFVKDRLDLPAESLAQLDALISGEDARSEPT
jgi:DNA helicase-2/ATP-dependent DNA helicase PcrA